MHPVPLQAATRPAPRRRTIAVPLRAHAPRARIPRRAHARRVRPVAEPSARALVTAPTRGAAASLSGTWRFFFRKLARISTCGRIS